MRLIDADALKEAVNHKKVVGRFNTIQLIDNAPTVVNENLTTERPQLVGNSDRFNCGAKMQKGGTENETDKC